MLKIGDKVIIKTLDEIKRTCKIKNMDDGYDINNFYISNDMLECLGSDGIILAINTEYSAYQIGEWWYTADMLKY